MKETWKLFFVSETQCSISMLEAYYLSNYLMREILDSFRVLYNARKLNFSVSFIFLR